MSDKGPCHSAGKADLTGAAHVTGAEKAVGGRAAECRAHGRWTDYSHRRIPQAAQNLSRGGAQAGWKGAVGREPKPALCLQLCVQSEDPTYFTSPTGRLLILC